jgi:hypothetical protein
VTCFFEDGLHRPYLPENCPRWSGHEKRMFLETIWAALREQEWASAEAVAKSSGVDEATLRRIVNFLQRWDFVETTRFPELRIRRKIGALSPVEVISLLRTVGTNRPPQSRGVGLVERVACRICGSHDLSFVAENEVECERCHERQWFAIEKAQSPTCGKASRRNLLKRLLVHRDSPTNTS